MGKLLEELKRRKVFRVAAVYAVVAWLLIQVADTVLPTFNAPQLVNQVVIFLLALGFPLAIVLAWAFEVTPQGIKSAAEASLEPQPASAGQTLNAIVIGLMVVAVGFLFLDRYLLNTEPQLLVSAQPESEVLRTWFDFGYSQTDPTGAESLGNFGFSSDGRLLVFTTFLQGITRLHVRELEDLEPRTLYETSGQVVAPAISPDGGSVIFQGRGTGVQTVPVSGGRPRLVVETQDYLVTPIWLSSDSFVLIHRNPTEAGFPVYDVNGEVLAQLPVQFSPGDMLQSAALVSGHGLLIGITSIRGSRIDYYDFATERTVPLLNRGVRPSFMAPNIVLFAHEGALWTSRIDLDALTVPDDPIQVVANIGVSENNGKASYAVSENGHLLHMPASLASASFNLVRIDRQANRQVLDQFGAYNYFDLELSPDDSSLAVLRVIQGVGDTWRLDLNRGTQSRITFSQFGNQARNAIWSHDGLRLYYDTGDELWTANADGSGIATRLTTAGEGSSPSQFLIARSISPDASTLLLQQGAIDAWDIVRLDTQNSEAPMTPLIASQFNEADPQLSPDGRWLTYSSDESGRNEIYLRPYPNLEDAKVMVSNGGGVEPRWRSDGGAIFFARQGENAVYEVEVELDNSPSVGSAVRAFSGIAITNNSPSYDVASDGSFLIGRQIEGAPGALGEAQMIRGILVYRFADELARLLPGN